MSDVHFILGYVSWRLSGAVFAAPAWAERLMAAAPSDPRLKELAKSLHGTVVAPGSPAYAAARLAESTRFDAIHPHAVVYCANAGDVEKAILWARKYGVHVVPRSGGHSYGGYSTTTGVIIDVSRLNQIHVAPGGKSAVISADFESAIRIHSFKSLTALCTRRTQL